MTPQIDPIVDIKQFNSEVAEELIRLLDWWAEKMPDSEHGGFYGRIDSFGKLYPKADKAIILNSRILWSFSAAGNLIPSERYRQLADRAFTYICQYFVDEQEGGVYWMLNHLGEVVQSRKQVYAQAFTIYAFAEYYLYTDNDEALDAALGIFDLLEQHSLDTTHDGYFEAFGRDWRPITDLRLSDKDANEAKTMNTHLHVLEAYTTLFRVSNNERVGAALKRLVKCFLDRFVDANTGHLHLFFDEHWVLKSDIVSYGHDIEASWLLMEAVELLDDPSLLKQAEDLALKLAKVTLSEGVDEDGAICNETQEDGVLDTDKHWWPQAEAVVGFWNAWQLSKEEAYQEVAWNTWGYIKQSIIDEEHGEWHWGRTADHQLMDKQNKAGPWKAPYHNSRMCIEMIKRTLIIS